MSKLNKSNTPDLNKVYKLKNHLKINGDGLSNKIYPQLDSMTQENSKMIEKKIVNNKPSQFGPILGVNFHMIKK